MSQNNMGKLLLKEKKGANKSPLSLIKIILFSVVFQE
tara:strand:- start:7 stop:117 length:111 start_codon:yes stop_codon:yes gene_type:complete